MPTATLRHGSALAVALVLKPQMQQERREGSQPQQHRREVMIITVSSAWVFRTSRDQLKASLSAAASKSVTSCLRSSMITSCFTTRSSATLFYDMSRHLYEPGQPRPDHYNRGEAYIWAVLRARDNWRVPLDRVITCMPDAEDPTIRLDSGRYQPLSRFIGTFEGGRSTT